MYGRINQRGGALIGSSKQFMIPLENKKHSKPQQMDLPKVQLVSPAEQVVQQAKDELREGIKRKRTEHSVIPKKRRRRSNTSKKRTSKKITNTTKKRNQNKKRRLKKSNQQQSKKSNKIRKLKTLSKRTFQKKKQKVFDNIFT